LPAAWQDCQTMLQCGQVHHHANHSAQQENAKVNKMNDTSGQLFTNSSASSDLQFALENKLRRALPMNGGMMQQMTWRKKVTPRGRWYSQLAVRVRRTKETGSTSALWPTSTSRDWKDDTAQSVQNVPVNALLGRAVHGFDAQTGGTGSLNPAFPCWLMGFPLEWDVCGDMVMPLFRKSRQNSSKQH
jgi:hypothetical protein